MEGVEQTKKNVLIRKQYTGIEEVKERRRQTFFYLNLNDNVNECFTACKTIEKDVIQINQFHVFFSLSLSLSVVLQQKVSICAICFLHTTYFSIHFVLFIYFQTLFSNFGVSENRMRFDLFKIHLFAVSYQSRNHFEAFFLFSIFSIEHIYVIITIIINTIIVSNQHQTMERDLFLIPFSTLLTFCKEERE